MRAQEFFVFYNVVEQIVLDLLRREVIDEVLE